MDSAGEGLRPVVLHNPFDAIRTRLTSGMKVRAGSEDLFRGDELEATVTILRPGNLGQVEVGLVCTEAYAVLMSDADGSGSSEGTSWARAYEAWVPVESIPGSHTVRLRVPADGPFSYEGDYLSFRWEVVARGVRKRRLDARARQKIHVRP